MQSLNLALTVFLCILGGVMVGLLLRRMLPQAHLKDESKDVVKLGSGLIATMVALVLGLLVSSAKASYDSMNEGLRQSGAKFIMLDRVLAQFGTGAQPVRERFKQQVMNITQMIWGGKGIEQITERAIDNARIFEKLSLDIQMMKSEDDRQKLLQNQANQLMDDIIQLRWSLIERTQNSLPLPFLYILIFWLTVLYMSFGLLAPFNATVITAFFIGSFSIASSIFLIHEMNHPVDGFIQLHQTPITKALELMGK